MIDENFSLIGYVSCSDSWLSEGKPVGNYKLDMSNITKKFTLDREVEDNYLANKAYKRLKEMDKRDNISFSEACDLAGWKKDKKVKHYPKLFHAKS
jgi:hypothetical protein